MTRSVEPFEHPRFKEIIKRVVSDPYQKTVWYLQQVPFALNRQRTYAEAPEALAALEDFIKEHDLSAFRIKSRSSVHNTGMYRNQFDKPCIEKYLKAVLTVLGEAAPRTHDLVLLNETAEAHDAGFAPLYEMLESLNPHAVITR